MSTARIHLAVGLALVLAAPGRADVNGFKVTTDRSIDTSSLQTIVQQVIERSGARTNDEKAIALYDWLHHTIFHAGYPVEPKPQSIGPLKLIHVYGWGLCGSQHTVLKALYETAGWECRYVGWSNPGHTTIEVRYDGGWHYFDVFLKCYFWSKDRSHVVSQEEIAADPSLVLDAVKEGRAARQHLCCGDTAAGILSGVKSRRVVGDSKGWSSCTWRDQNYSPALRLPAGAALRLDWKGEPGAFAVAGKPPIHGCGMKDLRGDPVLGPLAEHYGPRGYSSGQLIYAPDFSRPADLADVQLNGARAENGRLVAAGKATAIFPLPLPYAYVGGKVEADFDGAGQLFVSADAGRTWQVIEDGSLDSTVKQRYDVWLKAEFTGALARLQVKAVVEHNRLAQPYLLAGKNRVTVSAEKNALPADSLLVVRYTYQEAVAPAGRTQFTGQGLQYSEPKTVTREITALPFSFEIEVGGNTPPKMISLERAVRAR